MRFRSEMLGFQRTDPNHCGGQPNPSKGVVFCPVRSRQDLQLQFSVTVVVFFCFLIRNNMWDRSQSCSKVETRLLLAERHSRQFMYNICVFISCSRHLHIICLFFQSRFSIFLLHLLIQVSKNVKLILSSFQCQDLHIQTK